MTITFRGVPVLQPEQYAANVAYSASLGLGGIPTGAGRLAVVGSAHSLPAYEETLRRWPGVSGDVYDPANTERQLGAVWAVNGGFRWCKERGIPATFFSVHPTDSILPHLDLLEPGDHAILAQQSCPAVLDKALSLGAKVSLYGEREFPGAASATHAAYQGVSTAGFSEVTFFGCDLNFSDGRQHLNHDAGFRPLMVVTAAGEEYMTTPAYYSQALEIREMVRAFPAVFRERSAGMLRAMIEGPFHVTWLSPEILAAPDRGESVLQENWESITVVTGSDQEMTSPVSCARIDVLPQSIAAE